MTKQAQQKLRMLINRVDVVRRKTNELLNVMEISIGDKIFILEKTKQLRDELRDALLKTGEWVH